MGYRIAHMVVYRPIIRLFPNNFHIVPIIIRNYWHESSVSLCIEDDRHRNWDNSAYIVSDGISIYWLWFTLILRKGLQKGRRRRIWRRV